MIPGPVLFQEGAFLVTTEFIMNGGNPYQVESLPHYAEIYGPLYPWIMSWLASFWDCTFFLHRWTSFFFLVLSCLLLFLWGRECGIERRFSILGALLYFILCANSYSVAARPDTLGVFLLLLGIYVPLQGKFSKRSLALSIFLGLLAFLTKPYFIFSILCVSVYLFFVESKKKACLFFGSFCLTLFLAILTLQYFAPYYLHSTLLIHFFYQSSDFSWLLLQLKEFSFLHCGILFFTGVASFYSFQQEKLFLFSPRKVAQHNVGLALNSVSLGCAIAVLLSFMGWHVGAYLIYFFHLLTPFLLVYLFYFLQRYMQQNALFLFGLMCLLANLGVLAYQKLEIPKVEREKYTFFENLFASKTQILASPLFAHLYTKNNQLFYDSGHTSYFFHLALMKDHYFSQKEIQSQVFSYLQNIEQKIQNADFDFILIEKDFLSTSFVPRCFLQNYSYVIESKYTLNRYIEFPCYYFDFNKRSNYGKVPVIIELWIRKAN